KIRPGTPWTGGVTVVVPAYNEATGLRATLASLLDTQYLGPLEIVVVDDGSTDGTADLVEPPIRLIRQANAGKAAALNTGIAAATYDVLVLVDGDTVFQPDTLPYLLAP